MTLVNIFMRIKNDYGDDPEMLLVDMSRCNFVEYVAVKLFGLTPPNVTEKDIKETEEELTADGVFMGDLEERCAADNKVCFPKNWEGGL